MPPMFIISAALKDTTTQLSETIATSEVSSVYYSNYTDMVDALKLKITDNSNIKILIVNCTLLYRLYDVLYVIILLYSILY
jgi:hypothetical protein